MAAEALSVPEEGQCRVLAAACLREGAVKLTPDLQVWLVSV